jgi:predicted amidohydrolase
MSGPTVAWLRDTARALDAAVAGSLVIEAQGAHFNRFVWVTPDGECRTYDKRHLFRMAGEHDHYRAGGERLIVDWRGFRVCALVCYDLRFPVFARNRAAGGRGDYDVLLVVANWPRRASRPERVGARAIENHAGGRQSNRARWQWPRVSGGSACTIGSAIWLGTDVDGVFAIESISPS